MTYMVPHMEILCLRFYVSPLLHFHVLPSHQDLQDGLPGPQAGLLGHLAGLQTLMLTSKALWLAFSPSGWPPRPYSWLPYHQAGLRGPLAGLPGHLAGLQILLMALKTL